MRIVEELRAWAADEAEAATLEISDISDEQEALLNEAAALLEQAEAVLQRALPYVEWHRRHLAEPEKAKAKRIYKDGCDLLAKLHEGGE